MAPAKPPNDEGAKDKETQPTTPRRASAANNKTSPKRSGNNGVATPANRKPSNAQTPKSAPAAPGGNAGNAGVRKTSSPKKPVVEPTLLGDFFLGRPSPARKAAAARRRSADNTAVRQELRQQMREAVVRRVQQPGRVQSRVKDWQRANAAAMAKGNPEDTPSEPTEVAVHVDEQSVTEEDRVRIKNREKARRRSPPAKKDDKSKEIVPPPPPRVNPPPKKRVVSDDNWMKRNQAKVAPKVVATPARKSPIFQKPNNPTSMQDKVKAWAKQVEVPEAPAPPKIPNNHKPAKKYATKCGATITVEEHHEKASTAASGRSLDVIEVEEEAESNLSSSRTWKTESGRSGEDGIRVRSARTESPHASGDERLRVKPTRKKEPVPMDDGIRVRPIKSVPLPDDGIRVRAMENAAPRPAARQTSNGKSRRVPSTTRDRMPSARAPASDTETEIQTPARQSKSRVSARKKRPTTAPTITETSITLSDGEQSWTSDYDSDASTDRPSSAPAKSLAEVPFGDSAFSELDLPVGADHHHFKRPKPHRNTSSFGAVPKAFKKIMTGAKEIVQVAAEPPKPVVNQPPSIEKWLDGTVDPFVEKSPPQRNSLEKDWRQDVRRRSSAEKPISTNKPCPAQTLDEVPRRSDEEQANSAEPDVNLSSVGLKRSKATRATVAPQKQATAKIPLREALNNLFRGESTGHKVIPKAYSSYQDTELTELESEPDSEVTDLTSYMDHVDQNINGDPHVRSVNPREHSPPSPKSSYVSTDMGSDTTGPYMTPALARRRPPPTNGQYELSTIASEGSEIVYGSDTTSILSDSTVTQTTALTRSTAISRRNRGSGSKRRFTKHSDLVSVLSLPDDEGGLARASSIKSTSSLRRRTSNLEKVTAGDLLREFAIDEDLYRRELKTLVDGAVPVLLRQVVESKEDYVVDLFGPVSDGRADTMGKAVVNMGIALEKLKNLHNRSPTNDVYRILTWVLAAYPVYDKYLDVWRLGFEGIVVNLAPIPHRPDDEDSLVNAMPRNEYGDVVDAKGQPIDLQRLLTRPLARIRGLLKLLRGARAIGIKHPELELVIEDFTELQAKARRRHREETARKIDEDAINTDTNRCCDLRTLKAIEGVLIDPSRQVNAKDFFSLDLSHSSGQRLECQVELVFRDKPKDPMDRGDILIRDTGHARYCLLFPPVPKTAISARRGDVPGVLVVMIRGRHNGIEWYELLTLTTDLDAQILDWLDILGTSPLPPTAAYSPAKDLAPSPIPKADANLPLGERTQRAKLQKSRQDLRTNSAPEEQPKSSPPSRYHVRHASTPSGPTTPPRATIDARQTPSPERTPTQEAFQRTRSSPRPGLPTVSDTIGLREDMRPEPKKLTKSPPNSKPFRDDGAPRPPIHRTLSSNKPAPLNPPLELAPAPRIRRRGSSPLKHEFRPSDVSSESSESDSDSASDYDSSSDELDEADVPDTQPAISIKQTPEEPRSAIGSSVESGFESVVSDNSIAPSHSASQVGLYGQLGPGTMPSSDYVIKSIANISYWSNKKGQWGEAWHEPCSIVITPGLVEAYPLSAHSAPAEGALNSSGSSEFGADADLSRMQPLLALELTPIVMIRQSTAIDLEIRSPVRPYCKLSAIDAKIFRFRAPSAAEGTTLYMAVHKARLNNAKYKALEEEARFRSFGQPQPVSQDTDGETSSSNRRSWFGRKNSYRASTRAPSQSASQSQHTSSSMSAPSLLKRLTGAGSAAFNIDKSSVDRRSMQSRPTTAAASLYTSGSSSSDNMTPPRSPSVSTAENSGHTVVLGSDNLKVRCHLLVTPTKWEDHGNCTLQITRPPPGMRQELRIRHGMEKRVIVTKLPKRNLFGGGDDNKAAPLIVLDVVLGSKCFGRLGSRGIILNVWEDLRDEQNNVGLAPKTGGLSGTVKKWCFQCPGATEANWIYGLVAQEVSIGL